MSDETNKPGNNEEPGSQGANAEVASAGEPTGPLDTREASAREGISPEELDEREQRFTRPRKEMGPTTEMPETTPEEGS